MILLYAHKKDEQQAVKKAKITEPYLLLSPHSEDISYSASKIYTVGHIPIVDKYKGIAKVTVIDLERDSRKSK